ncbi:hypothetical protein [Sinorhizobium meliloti]|uniref:hypothetical protein n=1 Tax=Rhizobium meliloti TaxID=382 RepID=UPI000FDA4EC3|nr:hypothetical protein [Sinorhizobium meliloti]RVI43667.1 hypothetical protein CN195_28225 [Sinorhizobium meliloti]
MSEAFERGFSKAADEVSERTALMKGIAIVVAGVERDLKREFDTKIATLQKQIDELRHACGFSAARKGGGRLAGRDLSHQPSAANKRETTR